MSIAVARPRRLKNAAVAARDVGLLALDAIAAVGVRSGAVTTDVLCIRMDALGDFVIWLDAARALRARYADQRLVLMCDDGVRSLAQQVGVFDEVIGVNVARFRKQLRYRSQILRAMRSRRFALVLHPVFSRSGDFADGEALVRRARAPQKIGFALPAEETTWRSRLSDLWYTQHVPTAAGPMMELRRNADFIRGLGGEFHASLPVLPVSEPSPIGGNYFVLFPGAGLAHRRWPIARFAEIARRLHAETGWTGVVCGGPQEQPLADALLAACPDFVHSLVGKTSLSGYVAALAGAKLVISNDTSAVHIATAVGTPSVCILGGGQPKRFLPYDIGRPIRGAVPLPVQQPMPCDGCAWTCIHHVEAEAPFPCIDAIGVEQAWQIVLQTLGESKFKTERVPVLTGVA
jgi:ADP-heptose:LPS heptosyltransferase